MEYWGKEVIKFYTFYDDELGEIKVKVIDKFNDEGKQREATRVIPTKDMSGTKIHRDIVKQLFGTQSD